MAEQIIISGIFGIIAIIIGGYIRRNRRNKISLQPLNLSRIPTLLRQKKHIQDSYREHSIRLNTSQVQKWKSVEKWKIPRDGGESYLAMFLVVEANGPINIPQNEFPPQEQIIPERFIHLLVPNEVKLKPKSEIFVATNGCRIIYEQPGIEPDISYLQALLDMLVELIEAYPLVVALGGEAIQPLISLNRDMAQPWDALVGYLLRDIEIETTQRIGSDLARFLCKRCLTRCTKHKVRISAGNHIRYYGCRTCGQSRDLLDLRKKVVVVLDSEMVQDRILQNGVLRVNWFSQQTLFDFDTIEIRKISDEALERFCVQVGNDTDETRKPAYEKIPCNVSPNSGISDNSLKILRSMFGEVRVKEST